MADNNVVQLSYVAEATYGTTPNSALQAVPFVSGAVPFGTSVTRSAIIRSDAQRGEAKRVAIAPKANFNFEFGYGWYDEFLRAALRAPAWGNRVDVTFASTGLTITALTSTIAGVGIATGLGVGDWIYVSGTTAAGNVGWHKIKTWTSADSVVVYTPTASLTLQSNGPGRVEACPLASPSGTLGAANLLSYTLCLAYTDITKYSVMTGMRVNQFSLEQSPGSIISGAVAFEGANRAQATGAPGSGTINAATEHEVVSDIEGASAVWIAPYAVANTWDGVLLTDTIMKIGFQVSTPTRPLRRLGQLALAQMGLGSPEVTGSIEFLLDANTWAQDTKLLAYTTFGLAFSITLGSERYLFEFPQCHYTDEPASISGVDSDSMLAFSFAAETGGIYGATALEKTMIVSRVTPASPK